MAFAFAVLALLAVPGPTNTLLAGSGATVGISRSLRLLAGELAGYLISIAVLRQIFGTFVSETSGVQIALKWAIAAYLLFLAVRLWRWSGDQGDLAFTVRRVFVTTLLNPKALIFAVLIFPQPPAPVLPYFAGFAAMVVSVGAAWVTAGSLLTRFTSPRLSFVAPRICAIAMAAFAAFVVSGALNR